MGKSVPKADKKNTCICKTKEQREKKTSTERERNEKGEDERAIDIWLQIERERADF